MAAVPQNPLARHGRGACLSLRDLARYTHRVAISNRRLIAANEKGVTFKYKDYRVQGAGPQKIITLAPHEFIRSFLMHVLPRGFHRIRQHGLFANGGRAENLARAQVLLAAMPVKPAKAASTAELEKT